MTQIIFVVRNYHSKYGMMPRLSGKRAKFIEERTPAERLLSSGGNGLEDVS